MILIKFLIKEKACTCVHIGFAIFVLYRFDHDLKRLITARRIFHFSEKGTKKLNSRPKIPYKDGQLKRNRKQSFIKVALRVIHVCSNISSFIAF